MHLKATETPATIPPPVPRTEPRRVQVELSTPFARRVVALGGDLKSTICVGLGETATIHGPFGDLGRPDSYRSFVATADAVLRGLRSDTVVVHDLHPAYHSTMFARRKFPRAVAVQHHHAHGVSAALDAGYNFPVIAIVCDGTGFGTDGAIWGGEILLCRPTTFLRLAHLRYFPLPGGDVGTRLPLLPAMGVLHELRERLNWLPPWFARPETRIVRRQLEAGLNTVATSSLGRLFDAAAYVIGVAQVNGYEGQAAVELENMAGEEAVDPFPVAAALGPDGQEMLDWGPLFEGLVSGLRDGASVHTQAARFHTTIAHLLAEAAVRAGKTCGIERVVLSGGCFLNARLRREVSGLLVGHGMAVAGHSRVSTGDAGLSLGQAFVGAATGS